MKRKQRILRHYEPRIGTARENFEVLDWASAASQQGRFAVLTRNLDLGGKALLDVGCGLGDLLTYLNSLNIRVDYTGIDISEKMILAARQMHEKDGRFIQADLFDSAAAPQEEKLSGQTFDVVFCSGMFNLNLGNNSKFLSLAIARLMDLAKQYLVFNLLHARAGYHDEYYAYYDPGEVSTAIPNEGWEIRIIDDYLPNDFTVICRRAALNTLR
jgi:SAM-dependent methyltransferase